MTGHPGGHWWNYYPGALPLTHWGRVTHMCVVKLTTIGSDNGLSPCQRQAIIWTNARILFIRTLGTNLSEILGEIHSFSFSKMRLKMLSAKCRLFGLRLNELSRHWSSAEDLICRVVKSLKLIWGKALWMPFLKWVLETWLHEGIRIVVIAMAARWYALLAYWHLTVILVTMMINQGTYFMH